MFGNERLFFYIRSPCGVKIFNPPTVVGTPVVSEVPGPCRRSPSPLSSKTSGSSDRQTQVKYLSTSRSSSPTSSQQGQRSSLKRHSSRATTPTSPMFAKLFSARQSAYSSRESVCQRNSYQEDKCDQSDSPHLQPPSPHVSPCTTPAIRLLKLTMVYPWRNTTRSHTITNLVGLDRLRSGRNLSPGLFIWPPCIISPWVYL